MHTARPPATPAPLADVFISYSHHDKETARTLTATLRAEGFDVWWDEHIYAGAEWEALLMSVIANAKAVLVLWSPRSVVSKWVLKEALIASRSGRLVPVMIEACELPKRFAATQVALMHGWKGDGEHSQLERLLTGLSRLAPPSRLETVRPGFDSHFLGGTEIELPAITGVGEEFRYLHFSVVMNPARRLAWYVACNMARHLGPPAQRADSWLADPMLPASFQPQNRHFLGTGFDRGHIVSPRAVSWGSEREAQLANRQAFFWTNTAPQRPKMNQRWWLAVELWERALVESRDRAVAFAGPWLDDSDPVHGDFEQTVGRLRVRQNFRLPRCFWKLVLVRSESGALQSATFWFDQDVLTAGSQPGSDDAASYRCTLADLEARTGLDFGPEVRESESLP